MLSDEEKREMLEDARSKRRRDDFMAGEVEKPLKMSLDAYISFLDSIQKIFSPFRVTSYRTIIKLNKL